MSLDLLASTLFSPCVDPSSRRRKVSETLECECGCMLCRFRLRPCSISVGLTFDPIRNPAHDQRIYAQVEMRTGKKPRTLHLDCNCVARQFAKRPKLRRVRSDHDF